MSRPREPSLGLGASVEPGGVRFRVWAPNKRRLRVIDESTGAATVLKKNADGTFTGFSAEMKQGSLYRFELNGTGLFPDPCSRYQPQGPTGPSLVVDPRSFRWTDQRWRGVRLKGQVIYELHIGTFTPEGTFDSAAAQLAELKRAGMTLIEVMPINECPGGFNWGYDGCDLFAPYHVYGDAEAFKRFVNKAHRLGLGVILDVVYNHLGPAANYLPAFSDCYLSQTHKTEWGVGLNYDGPQSAWVRRYVVSNACYWVAEFHVDGLRLDATQDIRDNSRRHVIAEISDAVRKVARRRSVVLVGENEPQDVALVHPTSKGGKGLDALWSDDFHHTATVAVSQFREAYYTDYLGKPQEFVALVKHGFLYQGQQYAWQRQRRGTLVTDEPAEAFVFFTQNHDQVGNSYRGLRLTRDGFRSQYRAVTLLMTMMPQTPMFFMGQEFASDSPFLFFADHQEPLASQVYKGRFEFLGQFPTYRKKWAARRSMPRDYFLKCFQRSKLDFRDRVRHKDIYEFHRTLLKLRRTDAVVSAQRRDRLEASVLTDQCFAVRLAGKGGDNRLVLVNLGESITLCPVPDPIVALPRNRRWRVLLSSDDVKFGGTGRSVKTEPFFTLPRETAVLFSAEKMGESRS